MVVFVGERIELCDPLLDLKVHTVNLDPEELADMYHTAFLHTDYNRLITAYKHAIAAISFSLVGFPHAQHVSRQPLFY